VQILLVTKLTVVLEQVVNEISGKDVFAFYSQVALCLLLDALGTSPHCEAT